jgi:hypothetical protein
MTDVSTLTWAVLCKGKYPYFETIAAFDNQRVAQAYADECKVGTPENYQFKAVEIKPTLNTRVAKAYADAVIAHLDEGGNVNNTVARDLAWFIGDITGGTT